MSCHFCYGNVGCKPLGREPFDRTAPQACRKCEEKLRSWNEANKSPSDKIETKYEAPGRRKWPRSDRY